MNGHPPDITKHCGTAGKSHVNVVLAVVFSVVVLASGCHRNEEDEVRASFTKIPDYLLGTTHRCQAFVLYTFARMEDIPDETRRMKVLRDFTDRLFSVDISQTCPLEIAEICIPVSLSRARRWHLSISSGRISASSTPS